MNKDEFRLHLQYEKEVCEAKLKVIKRFQKTLTDEKRGRTANIEIVEDILRKHSSPLHISEIIEIARRDFHVELQRDSIVSNLTKKIKAGIKFSRIGPNTFTLKTTEEQSGTAKPSEGKE